MKVKKGDQVLIARGKDKGKKGKVLRSFPGEMKVLVEGVNIKKKHQRPRREGEKGQIVEVPFPLPEANVRLICPRCGQPSRVGYRLVSQNNKKKKARVCKKCGNLID